MDRHAVRFGVDLAVGQSPAALWEFDVSLGRLSWEPPAARLLGVDAGAVPGGPVELAAAVHPQDATAVLAAFRDLVEAGWAEVELRVGQDVDLRHLSLRGRVLDRDPDGRPARALGLVLDVTTGRAMEEQVLRMATNDALTALPNRRAFDQALRGHWRRRTRAREPISVLLLDIDGFRTINETHAHLVGDDALCTVARALNAALPRAGDAVTRFGGDEFAVVLPGVDRGGALDAADTLVRAVRAVSLRQASGIRLSVSAGTASWHPDQATITPADLVARADEAVNAAKADGGDRAVAYEDALAERAELESAIAHGLADGEFELYYQPVIGLAAGDVQGFEALMRWNRTGHGLVAPDSFIPVAEASTLICDLDRWALRTATDQLAAWSRQGLDGDGELRMAVNISGRHIGSPDIVADVAAALATAGIAPGRLELELTETALADGVLADIHLARIRGLGVRVAIDDFGTGHTSVGQLHHLPADTLKIDRSFVAATDPRRRALVALMVGAAHAFDLGVVAEGVEDAETLRFLRGLDCAAAQGFLMARPMPAGHVASWLASWRAGMPATLAALASVA